MACADAVESLQQGECITSETRLFTPGFARMVVEDKFEVSTTHWAKLKNRIEHEAGNSCPFFLIGILSTVAIRGEVNGNETNPRT